jgi:hypothetical protein
MDRVFIIKAHTVHKKGNLINQVPLFMHCI